MLAANLKPNDMFLAKYERPHSWPIKVSIFNHISDRIPTK